MSITVNGEEKDLTATTIAALIESLGYQSGSVAIACNEAFVPRGKYAETPVQSGDRIEIVSPMQGG
jgi:sulfur carrier protein